MTYCDCEYCPGHYDDAGDDNGGLKFYFPHANTITSMELYDTKVTVPVYKAVNSGDTVTVWVGQFTTIEE